MRLTLKQPKFLFLSAAFFGVLLTFQNCADPLKVETETLSSKADKFPFGFDTKVDSLAYMSCSGGDQSVFNNKAIWTFKMGSFGGNNSGVGLSQEFLHEAGKSRLSDQEKFLAHGKINQGAQLQMMLRGKNNLLEFVASNSSGDPDEGKDYDNLLAPLDSVDLLRPIVSQKGERVSFFNNLEGTGERRVEGHLYFNDLSEVNSSADRISAASLRSLLHNDQILLTMTYMNADDPENPIVPISPGDPRNEAFGVGFNLKFKVGTGNPIAGVSTAYSNAGAKVIQSVGEIDLRNVNKIKSQDDADWVCPDQLKFMIVRPEDNGVRAGCGGTAANGYVINPGTVASGVNEIHYYAALAVLPVEYWHIDFANRCIVPKDDVDACYDPADERPINYRPEDISGDAQSTKCGSADGDEYQCPHYVSICYRTN